MSQIADMLELAPNTFDDGRDIALYRPQKIQDVYGYQYLLKGEPSQIRGSIHREKFLEDNPFGLYDSAKFILSTKEVLNIGDLIEWDNELWAIGEETSFNGVMDLHHYKIQALYDYYAEFIIDTREQANRILGANSMRYLLEIPSDIPLIPSLFKPNQEKYISIDIYNTQTLSMPYKNRDNFIEQSKKDYLRFLAIGLNTNELQEFIFKFNDDFKDFGILRFPQWREERRYNKEFDIKSNIWSCEMEIQYNITTSNQLQDDKLIKKLRIDLNLT